MEYFSCPTEIAAGPGSVSRLRELNPRRLFLVTDPYFEKNGTARKIAAASGAEETKLYSAVRPDPTVELAAEGTAALRSFRPNVVAALGGGSAMDLAKAMVYFSGQKVLLAAIPTTSGSGSEVTDFAVLTHQGVKHPLVDPRLRPRLAILDSDLLEQLPPALIADTGFDVLTHAAEAMAAKEGGFFSGTLAKEAFSRCYRHLYDSFSGQREVRLQIHLASCMAGMAFAQSGLGLCHALSHSLGGRFHVPHGRLNAVLLPAVIGVNACAAGEAYTSLAAAAGISGSTPTVAVRNLRGGLIRLRTRLRLPATLAQAGIELPRLWEEEEEIAQAALADPCCRSNPRQADAGLIRQLLREVAGDG